MRNSYLATDHDSSWHKVFVRVFLDPVVKGDDVHTVEKLPLILMNSLHLDVKHGSHIHLNIVCVLDVLG